MDLTEIQERLSAEGFLIDEGNLIGGPFIPDGRCRIYNPTSMYILAEGRTLEEAIRECPATELEWQMVPRV